VCEAGDDASTEGIATGRHHDRNRSCGILGRQDRRRAPRQDHVHIQANQLGRQVRQTLQPFVGRSVFDREVLPLDVPAFMQTLSKCVEVGSILCRKEWHENSDPIHLSRLLRSGGERRGEHGSQAKDEGAAVHSIT
jgi:hypothetical protein